jgi:hypothetical protein
MYNILIKREGIERRKKSTGLLHMLAGLFLFVNAVAYYKQMGYKAVLPVVPFFLVAVLSLVYGFFRNRIDPSAQYNHWVRMLQFLMFSLLGIFMLKSKMEFRNLSLFIWAVICIPLLFTERKIFHDAALTFNQNNIMIPGYFSSKVVPWSSITNVIIRPDFVTIYYPDNRYVQYEVLDTVTSKEIEQINIFCQQKISEAAL